MDMSEQEKQEGQKTVIAFVSGLLIGGLLVWAFSSGAEKKEMPAETSAATSSAAAVSSSTESTTGTTATPNETNTTTDTTTNNTGGDMVVGTGNVKVADQKAGTSVALESATFPVDEGWIAVRSYQNDQLGSILGAARFSKTQGLIPTKIPLLASTVAGHQYAVVFFSDDGNREFNLDGDKQLDAGMFTFNAN